jgi:integrase
VADSAAGTFGSCVRQFITDHARPKTRRWRETARVLGLDYPNDGGEPTETKGGLAQRWATKDIRTIDAHDVFNVTDEARQTAIPGIVARNSGTSEARERALHAALGILFRWARRRHLVETNPCSGLERPKAPKARHRVLTDDEIKWFWQACDVADQPLDPKAPRPYGAALRLLLLTGQRLNEVAGMRRDELHADGTWHLPGSRTKNKKPHIVPLAPLAREYIADHGDFIFTTTGRTPVSGWSKVKNRLDTAMRAAAKAAVPPWRVHDLRRTFVTSLVGKLHVPPHLVELIVNHISGARAGVAGIYNQAEMLAERKAALERWAVHVHGIVTGKPANVETLHRAKS